MGHINLSSNEKSNVIPFKERMDHEFDVFVRKYLPENPHMGNLSTGTIKFIDDEEKRLKAKFNQSEKDKIISEFNERFLKRFQVHDNSARLAARQAQSNMSDEDYERYSGQLPEPETPTKPTTMSQSVKKSRTNYSGAGKNMRATSNDND